MSIDGIVAWTQEWVKGISTRPPSTSEFSVFSIAIQK